MLVRPANLNFSGECEFILLKNPGYYSLNMDILKSPKKWTPDYFSTV